MSNTPVPDHSPAQAAKPAAATSTPAPQPRMAAAPAPRVPTLAGLDQGLIFTSAVVSLAAVGIVVWVYITLQNTVANFVS